MLKFIRYLFNLKTKAGLYDQEKQKNKALETEKQYLIRENYRLSRNLTNALQRNQELVEQLVQSRIPEANRKLDLNQELNPEDLTTIELLAHQFDPLN